jgi:GDP-4-dehydro-6-deoxy-D-mannose reductase
MNRPVRVLVTGARGFVGQALSDWLVSDGQQVFGADRQAIGGSSSIMSVDLLDLQATTYLLERCAPEVIFHATGAVGITDKVLMEQAHVGTTRTLLSAARAACPAARIIVIGSAAEYGSRALTMSTIPEDAIPRPDSAYGRSKLKQSVLAQVMGRELGLDVICVRLFNTLGPGQSSQLVAGSMIQRLHHVLEQGLDWLEVFDPDSVRDFLDMRDVARLIWRVATHIERDRNSQPVQIASGEGTAIRQLAYDLLRVTDAIGQVRLIWKLTDRPTVSIGEPSLLRGLAKREPLRQISLETSLSDMWRWQIHQSTRGSEQ